MSHTPGPWGWDDSIGGWSNLRSMADGSEVVRVDSGRPENAADARLIAAAPELLEAAEYFIGYCDNCGGKGEIGLGTSCRWCSPLRAAIAKARGASPRVP